MYFSQTTFYKIIYIIRWRWFSKNLFAITDITQTYNPQNDVSLKVDDVLRCKTIGYQTIVEILFTIATFRL